MTCIEIYTKIAEILFTALTTLAAAYFGAKYAFQFQNDKDKRATDAANVKAANSVIFELARTYNKFLAVKKQFIDEHRNNSDRHLKILPIAGMSWEAPKFNYDNLSFLFKSSSPNLLGTLSLVEQEIASTLEVMRQRSTMHFEKLQPTIEKLSLQFGEQLLPQQIEEALGQRHAKILEMSTTFMIDGVDNVLAVCIDHILKIRTETQGLYPGHSVIGMITPGDTEQKITPS